MRGLPIMHSMLHQEAHPAGADAPVFALGFRSVVAGLAFAQTISWAILYYGFSSFVLPMMRDTGWPKATLMGAYTLALLVWGLANYAVGAAIDRGHGRAVMTWGTVLGALACAAWALVREPWMLYAAMAAAGAAMAMTLYEPAFNILTKRYPTRYRDGITALTLVAGFASTVSFPVAAWLIGAIGWRAALGVLAAVLLAVIAPLNAWLLRGPALVSAPARPDAMADATLQGALRGSAFWLLTLAFTLHIFAGTGLWAHVMPAFEHKGLPETQALWVVSLIGPAQVAGRLLWAAFGGTLSLHRLGVMVAAAMALAMALFAIGDTLAPLVLFALVFGLANGLMTIVRGAIVPEYFGRAHLGRIGGAMSAVALLARAAAPLAVAALLLVLADYTQAMAVMAALGVVATLAFALARPPRG